MMFPMLPPEGSLILPEPAERGPDDETANIVPLRPSLGARLRTLLPFLPGPRPEDGASALEDRSAAATRGDGAIRLVGVVGNPNKPSRTRVLVETILARIDPAERYEHRLVSIEEAWPALAQAPVRDALPPEGEQVVRAIETADLLVVGTPVYRGSYAGALKYLFDLVDQYALVDKPVVLAATGGSDRHALMIEHQLRPLFSFFAAATVPTGIYATEADFTGYDLTNPVVLARIDRAAEHARELLAARARRRIAKP